MKSFTLLLMFISLIACNQEKKKEEEGRWTQLSGECLQGGEGVTTSSTCSFRINQPIASKDEVTYSISFAFTKQDNALIEFSSASNPDLSQGIILRMQRDANLIRFYVRDHLKPNHEILASSLIAESGMSFKIRHVLKEANQKLILTDSNGTEVFNTNSDLVGPNSFSQFVTGGQTFGFKIKNAIIKSASF